MAEATVSDTRKNCDALTGRLAQLQAQITLIAGEGLESFQCMNDELQSEYLWGVRHGLDECKELAEQIASDVFKRA